MRYCRAFILMATMALRLVVLIDFYESTAAPISHGSSLPASLKQDAPTIFFSFAFSYYFRTATSAAYPTIAA